MTSTRHDVLVLGGGAAGCVVAARLSEDPSRRVCLLEAGPDPGPLAAGGWPPDLLDPHQLPVSHDWRYDEGLAWSARVIGGCSTHNACMLVWGADGDYDGWGEGWSAGELAPYRRRAERAIGLGSREEPGAWNRAVLEAAVEAGYPLLADMNDGAPAVAVGRPAVNERAGVRWNAALAYLEGARARSNLSILDRAHVDRVELESGRVRGAVAVRHGERLSFEAGEAVLAAGTFGSPAILLRSGIGPPQVLRRHGIRALVPLPGVGANLQNHWTARVMLDPGPRLAEAIAAEDDGGGVHMGGTIVRAASGLCEPGAWDLHLMAICWGVRDQGGALTGEYVLRIATAAMRPRSRGRVALRAPAAEAPPAIEHRPLSDPEDADVRVLADGLREARRIASSPSMRRLGAVEEAPGELSEPELRAYVASSLGSYYHPVGTCAIGADPDDGAVVDGSGAVYGVEGLYVADASVMPTIPRANTHLTTLAVAERLAERLR